VNGLAAEARAYLTRHELEESLRAELAEVGPPTIELPLLPEGVDRAALDEFASLLMRA
jgi:hypothetical protein